MSVSQYHPTDRRAVYRAPTMRVYHRRVVTPAGEQAGGPSWLRQRRADAWQPVELTWQAGGRLSTLTLRRQLGVGPGKAAGDRVEHLDVADGDMIRLVQADGAGGIEWFCGHLARREIDIQADGESCIVTAYGPELRLKGKVVSGRWHKTADADDGEIAGSLSSSDAVPANVFTSDLAVIFNEAGLPNASRSDWRLADEQAGAQACKVFEAEGRTVVKEGTARVEARYWTAYTALRSLVEHVDGYDVISPHTPWERIASLLGDTPLGEVRVEGMDLAEAIEAVLQPVGFGFAVEPWSVGGGAARHRLIVFPLHGGNHVKAPRLGGTGEGNVAIDSPAGRRAEVQRLSFTRDARRVANDVTVIGDQKRIQVVLEFHNNAATRDLHPLWDTALHDLDDWVDDDVVDPWQWSDSGYYTFDVFARKYNRGGSDHRTHRHVFRSFAWNEDAAFASIISAVPDLAACGLGGAGLVVRRPRPVASTFTYDSDGLKARLHPRKVQLGIVGDEASWIDVPAEIWNDRAGFTISTALLAGASGDGQWYPYAGGGQFSAEYRGLHYLTLLHNALRDDGAHKLRLRLVGSIECDQAVRGLAPRRASSAWPFRSARTARLPGRFAWRQVEDALGAGAQTDTTDDVQEATAYAERLRDAAEDCHVAGSVLLRYLTRSYAVGDGGGATSGRAIDLCVDGGAGSFAPVVSKVVWHFDEGTHKTELKLDGPGRQVKS